jgi:hypothetical protein
MTLTHQEKLEAIKSDLSCTISGLAYLLNQHRCTLGQKILNKLNFVGLDKIYIDYLYRKIIDKMDDEKLNDLKISGISYDLIDQRLKDLAEKHGLRKRRARDELAINSSCWLYIPNKILDGLGAGDCEYAIMTQRIINISTICIEIEFSKVKDNKKICRRLYSKPYGKRLFVRQVLRKITGDPELNQTKLRVSLPFAVSMNKLSYETNLWERGARTQRHINDTLLIKLIDIL